MASFIIMFGGDGWSTYGILHYYVWRGWMVNVWDPSLLCLEGIMDGQPMGSFIIMFGRDGWSTYEILHYYVSKGWMVNLWDHSLLCLEGMDD